MQKKRLYPGDNELSAVSNIIRKMIRKMTQRHCRGTVEGDMAGSRKTNVEALVREQEREDVSVDRAADREVEDSELAGLGDEVDEEGNRWESKMTSVLPLMRREHTEGKVGMYRKTSSVWDMLYLGHAGRDVLQVVVMGMRPKRMIWNYKSFLQWLYSQ